MLPTLGPSSSRFDKGPLSEIIFIVRLKIMLKYTDIV